MKGVIQDSVVIGGQDVNYADSLLKSTVIKDVRLVELACFFETSDFGVELAQDPEGARVKKVVPDTAFSKAGFRAGDRILALNGTKVVSARGLRQSMCREAIESKNGILEVKRGEEVLRIKVRLRRLLPRELHSYPAYRLQSQRRGQRRGPGR